MGLSAYQGKVSSTKVGPIWGKIIFMYYQLDRCNVKIQFFTYSYFWKNVHSDGILTIGLNISVERNLTQLSLGGTEKSMSTVRPRNLPLFIKYTSGISNSMNFQ